LDQDNTTATVALPTFSTSSQTRLTRACTEPTTSLRLIRQRSLVLSLALQRCYMGFRSTRRERTARRSLKSTQSRITVIAPKRRQPRQLVAKTRTTA
ncbi:hypothetical protein IWW46_006868, partial [Coemansia sp. RSA 2440]